MRQQASAAAEAQCQSHQQGFDLHEAVLVYLHGLLAFLLVSVRTLLYYP